MEREAFEECLGKRGSRLTIVIQVTRPDRHVRAIVERFRVNLLCRRC